VIGQYVTVAGDVISHVNISRVAVEDGGVYECAAENRVGRTTHSAPLRVYGNVTHTLMDVVEPTVDIYIHSLLQEAQVLQEVVCSPDLNVFHQTVACSCTQQCSSRQ
jgi:hypothetical protein